MSGPTLWRSRPRSVPAPELVPELGALIHWWSQVAAGQRSRYDLDALWRAACLEAEAREWVAISPSTANRLRRNAAAIIAQTAAGESLP